MTFNINTNDFNEPNANPLSWDVDFERLTAVHTILFFISAVKREEVEERIG